AKELIDEIKSTYMTAMFNEIKEAENKEAFNSPNLKLYKKDSKVILDNMTKAKELMDEFKSTYTTAIRAISPNPELYKTDNKIVLDNMRKAEELMDGFKSTYTTAMFNEIREAENR
ncbi:1738_t:CDS:2, partial [Dentiscutata heterogama]